MLLCLHFYICLKSLFTCQYASNINRQGFIKEFLGKWGTETCPRDLWFCYSHQYDNTFFNYIFYESALHLYKNCSYSVWLTHFFRWLPVRFRRYIVHGRLAFLCILTGFVCSVSISYTLSIGKLEILYFNIYIHTKRHTPINMFHHICCVGHSSPWLLPYALNI